MTISTRSRRVALTLGAIGMLAGSALATGGSSASARDAADADKITTDVKIIAEQFGWDAGATAEHLAAQADFGQLISVAANKFPKSFAGASFAEKPGAESQIMVAGEAPGALVNLIKEAGLKVEIVDGLKYTERQQQSRAGDIVDTLVKQGHEDVVTAILSTGEIQVSVSAGAKADTDLPKHLRDGVKIAEAPGKVSTDEVDIKGGVQVYGGGAQCTSGFSVRRISDGMRGITTAAHCTGMNRYNAPGPDVVMTFRGQHNGTFGDMEWHSTAENEIDNYFAGPGDERDVAVVWPSNAYAENMLTCVHSRMQSRRSCDRIYSTNVSSSGAGNLIATDNDSTVGGDSGGPWSWNNIADGIHKGDKWIWFGTRNVFSKAALLPAADEVPSPGRVLIAADCGRRPFCRASGHDGCGTAQLVDDRFEQCLHHR